MNALRQGTAARERGVLARYVIAASAARTADDGMAPALALLVAASGREAAFAGVLLAAAGLPHIVAGPLAGAVLDEARRPRVVLAVAPVLFGVVLAVAALWLDVLPAAVSVALVALAGCSGPLLMGGLSSELTRLVRSRPERAVALDGASYNLAAIAGPAAVAGGAALAGATVAALVLAGLAVAAAATVLALPQTEPRLTPGAGVRAGLAGARRLWDAPPLRRVTAGTTLAFAGAGALPLLVIARADELGSATAGAALLAAMAGGALAGALLSAAVGDRHDATAPRRTRAVRVAAAGAPEVRIVAALLVVGAALAGAAWAPGLGGLGVALVVAGIADGALLPAVLLVRTVHSSPAERGAVFTTAASIKVGAGAVGAAAGGVLVGASGAGVALFAAAALHVAGAALCVGRRDPRAVAGTLYCRDASAS